MEAPGKTTGWKPFQNSLRCSADTISVLQTAVLQPAVFQTAKRLPFLFAFSNNLRAFRFIGTPSCLYSFIFPRPDTG